MTRHGMVTSIKILYHVFVLFCLMTTMDLEVNEAQILFQAAVAEWLKYRIN